MTLIIHGATGAQGGPVAAALTATGHDVTAAVRSPQHRDGQAVAVDLDDHATLIRAYAGADGVFVHLPLGSPAQQLAWAENIVLAVAEAKPARVVFSTSGAPIDETADAESPAAVIASGLSNADVSFAIIAPRLYLENLLLPPVVGPVRSEGVLRYPIREDYAVSWCSHLDVADVAVRLFDDHSVTGVVGVGALPGLVGSDLAAGFAAHTGREVTFETQTPDELGAALVPLFGAEGVAPVVASYEWRLTQPRELIAEETSAQMRLGLAPRSVARWLHDVGA